MQIGNRIVPPLTHGFTFCSPSYPWPSTVWKHMVLLLTYHQKVNSSLTTCQMPTLFTQLHLTGILSSHIITRSDEYNESSTRYFEKDHILITFVKARCYNCSILLLVIVVSSLLCLINGLNDKFNYTFKLNHRSVCIGKNTVYIEFGTIHGFRHLLEVLECIPLR